MNTQRDVIINKLCPEVQTHCRDELLIRSHDSNEVRGRGFVSHTLRRDNTQPTFQRTDGRDGLAGWDEMFAGLKNVSERSYELLKRRH